MTPHYVRPPHSPLPYGNRFDDVGHDARIPTPRPSTAPPGLWAPAPEVVVKPKVRTVRAPRVSHLPTRIGAAECGKPSGYKRHRKNGEEACRPCKDAHNSETRKYNQNRPPRKQAKRAECGTPEGRQKHRDLRERACDECKEAAA